MIEFKDHPKEITIEWVAKNFDTFPNGVLWASSIECQYGIIFHHHSSEYQDGNRFFGFSRGEFIKEQKRLGIYKEPHRDGYFFVKCGNDEIVLQCKNGYWFDFNTSGAFSIDESLVIGECKKCE